MGASPTRQPLQPEATEAVMEVTKWLKPDDELSRARGEGPRRRYSSRDDRLCRRAADGGGGGRPLDSGPAPHMGKVRPTGSPSATAIATGTGRRSRDGGAAYPEAAKGSYFPSFLGRRGGPAQPTPVLRAMWGGQWWQPFLLSFISKIHKLNDYMQWRHLCHPFSPIFALLLSREVQMGRGDDPTIERLRATPVSGTAVAGRASHCDVVAF